MRARIFAKAALLTLLSGCSLTTGGFNECETTADCADGRICEQNYCVVNQTPEGCGRVEGAVDDTEAIAFGATLPMTVDGQTDQSEMQGLNSILLALDEVNQRQGVAGRRFTLHVCDSQGDSEKVKAQAAWLAEARSVSAIITSGSGQTIDAASETVKRNVLLMTATATSPELTNLPDTNGGAHGLIWRTAPSDALQGSVLADMLLNDAQYASVTRVGVLYVKDAYGDGLAGVLISAFEDKTKQLQALSYPRGGDISSVITQMNDFDPDLTVLVGFPADATKILTAAAATVNLAASAGHQWLFTDSAKDPALIAAATPGQIEGDFGTAPAQGAGAAYTVFSSNFKSKYGIDPAQFSFTSHSYDAMYLLALGAAYAIGSESNEVTGPRLAEGLTKISSGPAHQLKPDGFIDAASALQQGQSIDVVGASGTLNFNPTTGEAPGSIEVWQINGSSFTTVRIVEPPGT